MSGLTDWSHWEVSVYTTSGDVGPLHRPTFKDQWTPSFHRRKYDFHRRQHHFYGRRNRCYGIACHRCRSGLRSRAERRAERRRWRRRWLVPTASVETDVRIVGGRGRRIVGGLRVFADVDEERTRHLVNCEVVLGLAKDDHLPLATQLNVGEGRGVWIRGYT